MVGRNDLSRPDRVWESHFLQHYQFHVICVHSDSIWRRRPQQILEVPRNRRFGWLCVVREVADTQRHTKAVKRPRKTFHNPPNGTSTAQIKTRNLETLRKLSSTIDLPSAAISETRVEELMQLIGAWNFKFFIISLRSSLSVKLSCPSLVHRSFAKTRDFNVIFHVYSILFDLSEFKVYPSSFATTQLSRCTRTSLYFAKKNYRKESLKSLLKRN